MQEVQIQADLIRFHGMISSLFSLITGLELCEVPVIVPLPATNKGFNQTHYYLIVYNKYSIQAYPQRF